MSTTAEDDPWLLTEADRNFGSVPESDVTAFPLCDPSGVAARCTPSSGGIAGAQPPANGWHPAGMLSAAANAKAKALVAVVVEAARRIGIVPDEPGPDGGGIKAGFRPDKQA